MIKKQTYSAILVLFTFINTFYSQNFYDINTINKIEITFTESNWDEILDDFYAAGEKERLVGNAIINGIPFDSVGIRYKGTSSYDSERVKNPLNIKLDYQIKDQEIDGYTTLKLSNVFKDPSFVREVLGYEIARKYTTASLANFINVYVNGELIGLYSNVQSVDKLFLKKYFSSTENTFIKGNPTGEPGPGNPGASLEYFSPDSSSYYDYYEMKSDYGWQNLVNMIDTLNNFTSEVETVLNVDRLLWFLVYHNLLVNLDSPIHGPHNFYLYQDGGSQFNHIIWDLNMAFGSYTQKNTGPFDPPYSTTELQNFDPLHNVNKNTFPILNKILNIPKHKKAYFAHYKTMLEENFTNGWYKTRALEIQNIIDADVQADPNKFYSYQDFKNNLNNTISSVGFPPESLVGITELMEARIIFLNNNSDLQFSAPIISEFSNTPANPPANSTVWLNTKVENANLVQLVFRHSSTQKFVKAKMFDDGNHNDGSAGDGNYGVSVETESTNIQYYFYSENNDAAQFTPVRAENEFYTLNIAGSLVINELMAENETTIIDQDGEFEDWIELYNNSDSEISLNGYYLSDDISEPTKWTFPDTVIAPQKYLIVWTDKDEEQTGLHTNFKLSSFGETVILSDADQIVIDEISFGAQMVDISFGRFPNGTGTFKDMSPSFETDNLDGIVGISDEENNLPKEFVLSQNYPNPFNPSTIINFSIHVKGMVSLTIYNTLGQKVAELMNDEKPIGTYSVKWNASDLSSGTYLCRLRTKNLVQTKKLLLIK